MLLKLSPAPQPSGPSRWVHDLARLVAMAAVYQRPGMPTQHVPPVATTPSLPQKS